MNEKLNDALGEIRDEYIETAAKMKRKYHWRWVPAVAAILAAVLLFVSFADVFAPKVQAISEADYSLHCEVKLNQTQHLPGKLRGFFETSITQILSNSGEENKTYSPVNLYMALALTGELTQGNQQILQALGIEDLETLGKRTNLVWNACYRDKDNLSLLANSVWLQEGLQFNQSILDRLAENYFTSSYQANFGSEQTNQEIAAWINDQTGNLLKDFTQGINLSPDVIFSLYSTVYYRAKWLGAFSASQNTTGVFHGVQDATVTFMNKKEMHSYYCWGEDYGAIALELKDGSSMWFILPDADKNVEDVIGAKEYLPQVLQQDSRNRKYMKVNLSLPKFDISSGGDLREDLMAMGITDIFQPGSNSFSSFITADTPAWVSAVNQATRVAIDEEGVTAASYIEIPVAGNAAPPDEIIDFIVDRPFLFVITNRHDLPLFAGVVNDLS